MKHVKESMVIGQPHPATALRQQLFCIELVQSCTNLINELQRERGLSQLAMSPQAESYAAALREQVRLSDEAEQALREKLEGLPALACRNEFGVQTLERHGTSLLGSPGLADLATMRNGVLWLRYSREQALQAYCALIGQLLDLITKARSVFCDSELDRELATLELLMLTKEYSGQERASGSGLLACGRHDARAWQQTVRLIEAQHRCAAQFISQAGPSGRKRLKDSLSAETQQELEGLRRQLDISLDGAPLDPELCEVWFCTCSRRMNELREVELGLLADLQQGLQLQLERLSLPGLLKIGSRERRLTARAVETVLCTAAAWLAGDGRASLLRSHSTVA